jgi:hypothetical protein
MGLVWPAKYGENILVNHNQNLEHKLIANHKGQAIVEYILLLVVIVSMAYTLYSNPKFKQFFGNSGFFEKMRLGISESYRYGIESFDEPEEFQYQTGKHKGYFNKTSNTSRFFAPLSEYGNE